MKLKKLMKKAVDFFNDEKNLEQQKADELEDIIDQLKAKQKKLRKKMANESDKKVKKELASELSAVAKLLRQAKSSHTKIS